MREGAAATQLWPLFVQVPADSNSNGDSEALPTAMPPLLLLQEPLLSCVPHRCAQDVSRLCLLSAGTYWVVPSTYLPDTEGAFTVTIATRIDRWGPSIHAHLPPPCM